MDVLVTVRRSNPKFFLNCLWTYPSLPVSPFIYIHSAVESRKGAPYRRTEGLTTSDQISQKAGVVFRIYQAFADWKSDTKIVKMLNGEDVRDRDNFRKSWVGNTIDRILANGKYKGKWVWNKTESRRDPKTGSRRRFPIPISEWIINNAGTKWRNPSQMEKGNENSLISKAVGNNTTLNICWQVRWFMLLVIQQLVR